MHPACKKIHHGSYGCLGTRTLDGRHASREIAPFVVTLFVLGINQPLVMNIKQLTLRRSTQSRTTQTPELSLEAKVFSSSTRMQHQNAALFEEVRTSQGLRLDSGLSCDSIREVFIGFATR